MLKFRVVIGLILGSSVALFLLFLLLTISRLLMDYNENGKYFDETSGVTYSSDAIVAYSSITAFLFIISSVLFFRARRR